MPPDVSATWNYELEKVRRRGSSRRRRTRGIIVIFGIVRGAAFVPRRVITLSCVRAITKVTKNSRSCSRFRVVEQKERRRKRASERASERERERERERDRERERRRRAQPGGKSAGGFLSKVFGAQTPDLFSLRRYIMLLLREYRVGSGGTKIRILVFLSGRQHAPIRPQRGRSVRSSFRRRRIPSAEFVPTRSHRNNGLRFISYVITAGFAVINAGNNAPSTRDADFVGLKAREIRILAAI